MTKIKPRRSSIAPKAQRRKATTQPSKPKPTRRRQTPPKATTPSSKGQATAAMGRALEARDIMTSDVLMVSPRAPLSEVAKAMLSRHISGLPVVDDSGRLIGIVSEGDLCRRAETSTGRRRSWWLELFSSEESGARDYLKEHGRRVEDVMSRRVIWVGETTPVTEVAETLDQIPDFDGIRFKRHFAISLSGR